jgi:hypothetical protein
MEMIVDEPRFDQGFLRNFSLGTTNIGNGEYTVYGQHNLTPETVPYAAMASSSIPVLF